MNIGEFLTSWTIWIALAGYFAGLAGSRNGAGSQPNDQISVSELDELQSTKV